jgi:hypothetical protein
MPFTIAAGFAAGELAGGSTAVTWLQKQIHIKRIATNPRYKLHPRNVFIEFNESCMCVAL